MVTGMHHQDGIWGGDSDGQTGYLASHPTRILWRLMCENTKNTGEGAPTCKAAGPRARIMCMRVRNLMRMRML
jgi:hypothetical protein